MENYACPKVLIVGQSFNLNSGGGITMSNLFRNWPYDKIAVATQHINNTGYEYCTTYYRIGFDETKRPWPIHYIQPKYKSGPVKIEPSNRSEKSFAVKKSRYPSWLKSGFTFFLHFVGIYHLIFRQTVSQKFLKWFDEFKPELLYTQLSKLEDIRFVNEILDSRKVNLAVHIMDDWPTTINKPGIFGFIWKRKIDKEFRNLLSRSSVNMSICQYMSDVYKERYNLDFLPFHNVVDIETWVPASKTSWTPQKPFKVLYAGRIGNGICTSVVELAKAMEIINNESFDVEFQLQVKSIPESINIVLNKFSVVKQMPYISYADLPKKLSDVDLLIIPVDFDENALKFIRLSMPTKVPEYMISGTPILVYAPESTALVHYARASSWGYVVSTRNIDCICTAIKTLMNDIDLRQKIGSIAKEVALTNHVSNIVRDKFHETLKSVVNNRPNDNGKEN